MAHGHRHSSVVRELGFKSENPGFNPLAGQGGRPLLCPSESTLVQTCLCLDPYVCTARIQRCAHAKDPMSICRKRLGLAADGTVIVKNIACSISGLNCPIGEKQKKRHEHVSPNLWNEPCALYKWALVLKSSRTVDVLGESLVGCDWQSCAGDKLSLISHNAARIKILFIVPK